MQHYINIWSTETVTNYYTAFLLFIELFPSHAVYQTTNFTFVSPNILYMHYQNQSLQVDCAQ